MKEKGKIALVTGGSRGLGRNMALSLAKKGLHVIVTYHSKKEEAETLSRQIQETGQKSAVLRLDTTAVAGFDAFFKSLDQVLDDRFASRKIDFLINNAGFAHHVDFSTTSEQQFDELMNVHVKGVFFLTQRMLSVMNDGGGIVNISTGLTRFAIPGYAAYALAKSAVETLTRYQAKELGARKIRVNAVAPGAIETDFGGGVVRDDKALNAYLASNTALGRVGVPDDIGDVVAFLCTDEARWITAQRIEVSGGQML